MRLKRANFNIHFKDEISAKQAFNLSRSIGIRGVAAGWLAEVKGDYNYLNSFLRSADPDFRREGIYVLSELPYYASHGKELITRIKPFLNDPDEKIQRFVQKIIYDRMSEEEKKALDNERIKADEMRKKEKKLLEQKNVQSAKSFVFSSAKIR